MSCWVYTDGPRDERTRAAAERNIDDAIFFFFFVVVGGDFFERGERFFGSDVRKIWTSFFSFFGDADLEVDESVAMESLMLRRV